MGLYFFFLSASQIWVAKNWHIYLAHVIEKPNLRILNPQYFLLFKWKLNDFFIHFEFDRGGKKTKCIHKLNVIKKIVVTVRDSEIVNLVFRWREQDISQLKFFCQYKRISFRTLHFDEIFLYVKLSFVL